ncbi:hypothetical protein CEP52_009479 [Fusarium oligoseptatum]|uniref:Major facilitator superfamily (MFS) profile domain-containing protein n=1 Tax=Fusarium oligoseptatum TaxID=2604345 RepID=A0A428TCP6_9HYPO|nr:hypothetical protein CEP52_009479 [Fusarium oligoseptatum]
MATTTQLEPVVSETYQLDRRPINPPTKSDEPPGHQSDPAESNANQVPYLKLISAGFSFFVAGVNDGSTGALVPFIIRDYGINTAIVSSVYGANFMGWFLTALTNTHLSQKLDLGAMLMLGAVLQVIAHALRFWRPPFELYAVTFWLVSLGQAYQDTHGNTFVTTMKGAAHRWLAFIHSMYMAGCFCGPFVATAVSSAGETSRWYLFYCLPLALGVINVILVFYAFRETVGFKPKQSSHMATTSVDAEAATDPDTHTPPDTSEDTSASSLIRETLKTRSVWLLSIFFFFSIGATLTASSWVVEYLVEIRDGDLSKMGYVSVGFNGGSLLGRIFLAEPTHRFGVRKMIFIYSVLSIGLHVLFWQVPNIIAASISISLLGFLMGPYFATASLFLLLPASLNTAHGVSVGSKLFAPRIYSTGLAFVFVFAQLGACFFPIVTGAIASQIDVSVMQPILCALLVATSISWLFVPNPKESENTALHHE